MRNSIWINNEIIAKLISINISSFLRQPNNDTVFHYTSPAGLAGIVQDQCLRGSDYGYLNDLKEGKLALNILRKNCCEEIKSEYSERMYDRICHYIDQIDKDMTISNQCFYGYIS